MTTIPKLILDKGGYGYVDFEFGCNWDEEHGFRVMTHKDRIIDMGGGDTAIYTHDAEEDRSK